MYETNRIITSSSAEYRKPFYSGIPIVWRSDYLYLRNDCLRQSRRDFVHRCHGDSIDDQQYDQCH